jgi:hypothetical protein
MFHVFFFPGGGSRKLKQNLEGGGAQGVKVWEPLL